MREVEHLHGDVRLVRRITRLNLTTRAQHHHRVGAHIHCFIEAHLAELGRHQCVADEREYRPAAQTRRCRPSTTKVRGIRGGAVLSCPLTRSAEEGLCRVRAVLFDLDGTLLDLDLRSFLRRYFVALEHAATPLLPSSNASTLAGFMEALHSSVGAMMEPHENRTNEDVFYEVLHARSGVDLRVHWPVFERFYAEVFPTLRDTAAPMPGGREAVLAARELGLGVAIATNPIFPMPAITQRLAWAGLDDLDLPVVTSYETMRACKPHAEYYRQVAAMLGVAPSECLMVGDDRALDLPAADVGMRTYYVGSDDLAATDLRGDLRELAELLPRLV